MFGDIAKSLESTAEKTVNTAEKAAEPVVGKSIAKAAAGQAMGALKKDEMLVNAGAGVLDKVSGKKGGAPAGGKHTAESKTHKSGAKAHEGHKTEGHKSHDEAKAHSKSTHHKQHDEEAKHIADKLVGKKSGHAAEAGVKYQVEKKTTLEYSVKSKDKKAKREAHKRHLSEDELLPLAFEGMVHKANDAVLGHRHEHRRHHKGVRDDAGAAVSSDANANGASSPASWVGATSAGVVVAVCACVAVFATIRRRRQQTESATGYAVLV